MKNGNNSVLMNLATEDQELLWKSMCRLAVARSTGATSDDLESARLDYARINTMINSTPVEESNCIPMRFHRVDIGTQVMLVPAACTGTLGDVLDGLRPVVRSECRVLIQGIEVDRDITLVQLYEKMQMPDNFLHVVVRE